MFFWKALQTFAGSFYIAFGLDSFLEANYSCKGLSELTMEVFFQRVLQAGLCSGAQLADSFVFLSQPAHRATQALQLGRVVLAAQTIEAFLGGADVALLTLQFFLNFLEDKSMPWRMFFASKRNMLPIPWWSFFWEIDVIKIHSVMYTFLWDCLVSICDISALTLRILPSSPWEQVLTAVER